MRSSKKVPGTTIKSRVLALLESGEILTATEAAHRTGSHWSTTSSLLYRLCQQGVCDRIPCYGPLRGYGYFLARYRGRIRVVGIHTREKIKKLKGVQNKLVSVRNNGKEVWYRDTNGKFHWVDGEN